MAFQFLNIFCSNTLFWINLKQFKDEVFSISINGIRYLYIAVGDIFKGQELSLAFERSFTDQHLIQDNPQWPQITCIRHFFILQYLWRHIFFGANKRVLSLIFIITIISILVYFNIFLFWNLGFELSIQNLRCSEINKFDMIVFIQEYVSWL